MHTQTRYIVAILFGTMTVGISNGAEPSGMHAECAPLVDVANRSVKSTHPGYVYLWGNAYGTHRLDFFDPHFDLLYGKIDLHLTNQTMPLHATDRAKLDHLEDLTALKNALFEDVLNLGVKSKFPVASTQYFDPLGCTRKDVLTASDTGRFRLGTSSALDVTKLKL